jgi:hypothetical protein
MRFDHKHKMGRAKECGAWESENECWLAIAAAALPSRFLCPTFPCPRNVYLGKRREAPERSWIDLRASVTSTEASKWHRRVRSEDLLLLCTPAPFVGRSASSWTPQSQATANSLGFRGTGARRRLSIDRDACVETRAQQDSREFCQGLGAGREACFPPHFAVG